MIRSFSLSITIISSNYIRCTRKLALKLVPYLTFVIVVYMHTAYCFVDKLLQHKDDQRKITKLILKTMLLFK